MPANKNALIRYKTIDRCLRNRYRRWTIDDLVDACSDALYDMEGITKGISKRTVQGDIQIMRSDKLGYNAPIETYGNGYYRYSDPDYSISDTPLTSLLSCTPSRTRTCDLIVRSETLYPTELWEHILAEAEGFEPTGPFRPTVFKTAALDHSAILPIFDCKGTIAGCSLFAQPKII